MDIVVPLISGGNRRILFTFMIGILEKGLELFKSLIRPGFWLLASVLTLGFSACAPGPGYEAFTWNATVAENVWGHLDREENSFTVEGNRIRASPWLESFYRRREGRLAWSGPRGPLRRAHLIPMILAFGSTGNDNRSPDRAALEAPRFPLSVFIFLNLGRKCIVTLFFEKITPKNIKIVNAPNDTKNI